MKPMGHNQKNYSRLAPILILAYNRPEHLKRLLDSLGLNTESKASKIYIAIDGAKNEADKLLVNECHEVASQAHGFHRTIIWTSKVNLGLANSVINSVNKVLKTSDSIIVLEDDLVVSPSFLNYMNSGLTYYASNSKVAAIHGYQYPLGYIGSKCTFRRGTDCWGWGTWRNRWEAANLNSSELIYDLKARKMTRKFNLDGFTDNLKLLKLQNANKIDSWAIRWHASMFLQEKFTLYPPESLVLNLGLDGSGTHEGKYNFFRTKISHKSDWTFPADVEEDRRFIRKLIFFYIGLRIKKILIKLKFLK